MKTEKIQADKLAPEIIGGIIETIEEKPVKDLDWIESVTTSKDNTWKLWIKSKAKYYPETILKYNKITKSRVITGKLYQIEEKLTKVSEKF